MCLAQPRERLADPELTENGIFRAKRKSRALKVGYEAGKSEARYRFTSSHCRAIQTHDILYSAHCPGTKAIVLDVSLFRSMEASASKIEYHQ